MGLFTILIIQIGSDRKGINAVKQSSCLLVITALLFPFVAHAADLEKVSSSASLHRRPVAVRLLDETTAVVANRRSGTLTVVDLDSFSVAAEFNINGQPTDLDGHAQNVLVTDAAGGRLMALRIGRVSASVNWELRVPTHPVSVRISQAGDWCSVCSLWGRKVVFVKVPKPSEQAGQPQIIATVDLPFAPREQLILKDASRLIVADAFGDRLAVIRLDSYEVEAIHSLPAHNIRGLALSPDGKQIFVTHQLLNELSPPRRSEIIWGGMMADSLRVIWLKHLLNPKAQIMKDSRFILLGNGTRGAGDPDALRFNHDGRVVIALAGTNEVAVVEPDGFSLERVAVGRRPVAISPVGDNKFLVVSELSDLISRIDLKTKPSRKATKKLPASSKYNDAKKRPVAGEDYIAAKANSRHDDAEDRIAVRHLKLGSSPKPGAAERGEAHFFDARLSLGGWYSCHSCHTDGHSSGGLADTFGDGHEGAPKRILSLLGVSETGPWAWLGNKQHLNDQLHQSLRLTMQGRRLASGDVGDLNAFLTTLKPPPPFQPATSPDDLLVVEQGRRLFESLECNSCHAGHTLTSKKAYDVGLTDDLGSSEFNPPSLRGVAHRYGLFHDKRAANVGQVVRDYKHQLPRLLSVEEQQTLIRYLKSL